MATHREKLRAIHAADDINTPVVADMPRLADCWTKKPTLASFSGLRK
jgi:hypothetical protein